LPKHIAKATKGDRNFFYFSPQVHLTIRPERAKLIKEEKQRSPYFS
jgi:hypothetical protein